MKSHSLVVVIIAAILVGDPSQAEADPPIVIAHRGACGYLPEHTLASVALAHQMGADYIEQDVVITKDDRAVVLHDIYLDAVTDVADAFPDRRRDDGHYYAIDFTLNELRDLRVHERVNLDTGEAVYPNRFPVGVSAFLIATLEEHLELIRALDQSSGCNTGIYLEIKRPAWHRRQGKDASRIILQILSRYGYQDREDRAYLQCFDREEMKRLRSEFHARLKTILLLDAGKDNSSGVPTEEQLRSISNYADGIGTPLSSIVTQVDAHGEPHYTGLVDTAHRCNLIVHVYTFRADAMPNYVTDFPQMVRLFAEAKIDGFFTDFPDRLARELQKASPNLAAHQPCRSMPADHMR